MRTTLMILAGAGLLYVVYRAWNQATTPGAGGTSAAIKNWVVSPVGIGSAGVLGYLLLTKGKS